MPSHRSDSSREAARPDAQLRELDAALVSLRIAVHDYAARRTLFGQGTRRDAADERAESSSSASTRPGVIRRFAAHVRKIAARVFTRRRK